MDCVSLRKDGTKFVHFVLFQITLLHATNLFSSSAPFSGQDEVTNVGTERKYYEYLFMLQVYLKMFDFDENIICDWYFDSTHRLVIWWIRTCYDSFLSVPLIE